MEIIRLLFGIALLAFGRRLFWLFVAAAGFIAGLTLAPMLVPEASQSMILVVALVAGLIGAVLAVFLQGLAVALAGFAVGGYIALGLLDMVGVSSGQFSWLPFIIGGILGAVLIGVLFDWALILLSSLAGASLVVLGLGLTQPTSTLAYIILAIIGFLVQAGLQRAFPPRPITRRASTRPPSIRR